MPVSRHIKVFHFETVLLKKATLYRTKPSKNKLFSSKNKQKSAKNQCFLIVFEVKTSIFGVKTGLKRM